MKYKTDGAKIAKIESVCDDWLGLFPSPEAAMLNGTLTTVVLPCIVKHARTGKKFDTFEPIVGALIAAHIVLNGSDKTMFACELMKIVIARGRDMHDFEGFGNLDNPLYCDAGLVLKAIRFNAFSEMPREKQLDTLIDFVVYWLARHKLLKSFLKNFAKGGN